MRPADFAALSILAIVWGAAFMLIRAAVPDFGPLGLTEVRVLVGTLVLLALGGGRVLGSIRRRPIAFLALGIGFSTVPFTLISFASQTLPASTASVLNATTPLLTTLAAALWLGVPLTTRRMAGAAVGVTGILVLVGWAPLRLDASVLLAIAASLGAAASYAVSGTFVRRQLSDVPPIDLATAQLGVSAVLLSVPTAAALPPHLPSMTAVTAAVILAVASTGLAWPIYYRLLARSGPTAASTVTLLVPVSATAWGAVVLGEQAGPGLVPAAALVIASVLLVTDVRVPTRLLVGQRTRRLAVGLPQRFASAARRAGRP